MKKIFLNGIIGSIDDGGDISLSELQNEIGNEKEIKIYLNSNGGDVREGKKIYDYLSQIQEIGTIINIIDIGSCYSMASMLLVSVPLENRHITENSDAMLHFPLIEAVGNSFQLKEIAEGLEELNEWFIDTYEKRTKLNREQLNELLYNEIKITADQAVEFGIVGNKINTIKAVAFISKNENNLIKMNVIEKLKEATQHLMGKKDEAKAMEVMGNDNLKIVTESETLEIGTEVQVFENDTLIEDYSGEITLENGNVVIIENNVITAINETVEDAVDYKTENENLRAEIEDLKQSIEEATNIITEYSKPIGKPIAIAKKQVFVKNVVKKENGLSEVERLLKNKRDRNSNNKKGGI